MTKESIAHLAFHPTSETLLLAAADKQGNVGLWHCEDGERAGVQLLGLGFRGGSSSSSSSSSSSEQVTWSRLCRLSNNLTL